VIKNVPLLYPFLYPLVNIERLGSGATLTRLRLGFAALAKYAFTFEIELEMRQDDLQGRVIWGKEKDSITKY